MPANGRWDLIRRLKVNTVTRILKPRLLAILRVRLSVEICFWSYHCSQVKAAVHIHMCGLI